MTDTVGYAANPRIRVIEYLPWVAAIAVFFLLPEYLALGTRILIWILFVLSVDLVLGYAGIVTLGHSVFFGLGGYTAGILGAKFGLSDPILQMIAAGAIAGLFGALTASVILKTQGLTVIMLTLALSVLGFELVNKMGTITGGIDGLPFVPTPIFGTFRFDIFGRTAYIYCLLALFVSWFVARRLVYSPFGTSLVGIRENLGRSRAIGTPVFRRLLIIYVISAIMAGVAGALLAQTTQLVGIGMLGFEPSGDALIMLILAGVGRLYGAFLGPIVYLVVQDQLAKEFPEYWYLGIGLMLMVVVLIGKGGLLAFSDAAMARLRAKR